MTRHERIRVVRFILVNGVGTVIDVSLVFLLTRVLSLPLLLAVFCGWLSSMLCGFFLNRHFVFSDGRASLFTASRRYLMLVLFNFGVGVGLVTLLVSAGWNYLLARLLSSAFLVVFNFGVARWWVFVVKTGMSQGERAALDSLPHLPAPLTADDSNPERPDRAWKEAL